MPVNLYYTQRVRGFQQVSEKYTSESATFLLRRTKQRCPRCGSVDVVATPLRRRSIRGEPLGSCREVHLEFTDTDMQAMLNISNGNFYALKKDLKE